MHGGAEGSGAPKGKRNGNYRHGFYTAEAVAQRRAMLTLVGSYRTDGTRAEGAGVRSGRATKSASTWQLC
jgi:hypothetical protein